MLIMKDEDFAQNRKLLFEEVVKRDEDALIEVESLGCFRVSYEPSIEWVDKDEEDRE